MYLSRHYHGVCKNFAGFERYKTQSEIASNWSGVIYSVICIACRKKVGSVYHLMIIVVVAHMMLIRSEKFACYTVQDVSKGAEGAGMRENVSGIFAGNVNRMGP